MEFTYTSANIVNNIVRIKPSTTDYDIKNKTDNESTSKIIDKTSDILTSKNNKSKLIVE
jgi:hypothetical protein